MARFSENFHFKHLVTDTNKTRGNIHILTSIHIFLKITPLQMEKFFTILSLQAIFFNEINKTRHNKPMLNLNSVLDGISGK